MGFEVLRGTYSPHSNLWFELISQIDKSTSHRLNKLLLEQHRLNNETLLFFLTLLNHSLERSPLDFFFPTNFFVTCPEQYLIYQLKPLIEFQMPRFTYLKHYQNVI